MAVAAISEDWTWTKEEGYRHRTCGGKIAFHAAQPRAVCAACATVWKTETRWRRQSNRQPARSGYLVGPDSGRRPAALSRAEKD